jgi:hypothetical protein
VPLSAGIQKNKTAAKTAVINAYFFIFYPLVIRTINAYAGSMMQFLCRRAPFFSDGSTLVAWVPPCGVCLTGHRLHLNVGVHRLRPVFVGFGRLLDTYDGAKSAGTVPEVF